MPKLRESVKRRSRIETVASEQLKDDSLLNDQARARADATSYYGTCPYLRSCSKFGHGASQLWDNLGAPHHAGLLSHRSSSYACVID